VAKGKGAEPRKAEADNYITKGDKGEWRRDDTRAWRLAKEIIGNIKEGFNIYEGYGLTEVEQAEAVVAQCGGWMKYCPEVGWLVYNSDNGCWKPNYAEAALHGVVEHFAMLRRDGAYAENGAEQSFVKKVMSDHGINAVINIIKHHPNIEKSSDEFDAAPHQLNCLGEMVDLRDGSRRPTEPEDYVTRSTRFRPAPAYKGKGAEKYPEKFFKFMEQITSKEGKNRPDLALWLLAWFGYCLSGDTSAQFFVNFHGRGRNGKGVLLSLMYDLFGGYATPLAEDLAIENMTGSGFDMADLPGVRLAMLHDAPEGRLNMRALKPIVAGDVIKARRKYKDNFDFHPICKVAIASNPRLTLKETGLAIKRRVRMAPFDYTVPEEEVNPFLQRELLEEGAEITAALIECAVDYYKNGCGPRAFPECSVIDETSREYIKSEDQVAQYIEEKTAAGEGGVIKAADLYGGYAEWAAKQGTRPMNAKRFGDRLALMDIKKERRGDGVWYVGIAFKDVKETVQPKE
jgi:putative DNA primase/helicase